MRVLYLCHVYDPSADTPEALLRRYFLVPEWCRALKSAGVEEVSVLMRFRRAATLHQDGVAYRLVRDRLPAYPPVWAVPSRLHAAAAAARADIVHFNGMIFPLQVRALARTLAGRVPIVVQSHDTRPPGGAYRRLARWGLGAAGGVLFSAEALAEAWRDSGALPRGVPSFEVMETPTHLPPSAGRDFGSERYPGSPRFLWLANLDPNKDPLTVLEGFSRVIADFPRACLLMAYRGDGLLERVRSAVRAPALAGRVHLLGEIPREALRDFLAAGDFLLQGSHREGSSLAVLEALACGVHPIVTDIEPLRTMIGDGAAGTLWRVEDAGDLARAIREAVTRRQGREQVRAFFDRRWSHEAIGRAAVRAYEEVIRARRCGTGPVRLPRMAAEMDYLRLQARLGATHLHAFGKRASRPLLEGLALAGGESVLEIGCGTGGTMVHVASRHAVRLLGVDRMPEMLATARRRLRLCRLAGRCRVVRADAAALPFGTGSFDRVYAESAIAFQDEASAMGILDEARRVLRPGGLLVLNETLWLPGVPAAVKVQIHDRMVRLAGTPPACRRDWDAAAWRSAFESRGFRVERFEPMPEADRGRPTWRDRFSDLYTALLRLRGRLDPGLRASRKRLPSLAIDGGHGRPLMGGYLVVLM